MILGQKVEVAGLADGRVAHASVQGRRFCGAIRPHRRAPGAWAAYFGQGCVAAVLAWVMMGAATLFLLIMVVDRGLGRIAV
nr:hypothetical protein [Nonomuraea aurantiaca]